MSEQELSEIRFFGDLVANPQTILYRASEEEQRQAARLLKARAGRSK